MSRRKIRRRAYHKSSGTFGMSSSALGRTGGHTSAYSSSFFARDPRTGQTVFATIGWQVEPGKMEFMPVYQRAHLLMPIPRSRLMDPDEYRDEQGPAMELLKKALSNERTPSDDVLRALAILGHSPNQRSIRVLSRFSSSRHFLAPVAHLALGECTGLFSYFCKNPTEIKKKTSEESAESHADGDGEFPSAGSRSMG